MIKLISVLLSAAITFSTAPSTFSGVMKPNHSNSNSVSNSVSKSKDYMSDLFYDGSPKQHAVDDDVFYYRNSKDFDEVVQYIKNNFDSKFDVSDYDISEDYSVKDESDVHDFNSLSINYKIDGLISDYGYSVLISNSKVFMVKEVGTPISKDTLSFDKKDILSDEELCKKALEAEDDITAPVAKQTVYKWIDSASGKIKYTVDTVYGTDGSGYSADGFEYTPFLLNYNGVTCFFKLI